LIMKNLLVLNKIYIQENLISFLHMIVVTVNSQNNKGAVNF